MTPREEFVAIYNTCIRREGADNLLAWLEKSDMFTAPASTKYHLACSGGLCQHSVNVYRQLGKLYTAEFGEIPNDKKETLAIVSLLHDLCKVNF